MNKRAQFMLPSLCGLLFIVLTQFQNCAPSAQDSATASSAPEADARLIEDFNNTEIQFVTVSTQFHSDATEVSVDGFCSRQRSGSVLHWNVNAFESESVCERGEFRLPLVGVDQMECGVDHPVQVKAEWGAMISGRVSRRCPAVKRVEMEASASSPVGTSCELELSESGSCTQVCYRDLKVVLAVQVDQTHCASTVASH